MSNLLGDNWSPAVLVLSCVNKIKAELLNKFFQSVFTIEDTTQGIPIFPPRTDQKLETISYVFGSLFQKFWMHLIRSR
jgi:hypothetical protein